jgi:hypothetical protein
VRDPWFERRPPRHQIHPVDWRGWTAVGVFLVFQLALALGLLVAPSVSQGGPSDTRIVAWGVVAVAALLVFVVLARAKSVEARRQDSQS